METETCFDGIIKMCVSILKPFHGLLLKAERQQLLDKLPQTNDGESSIVRFINAHCPTKNLKTTSERANLPLDEVFRIVAHLIHWGDAILIFPLAETNLYALSMDIETEHAAKWVDRFNNDFPGYDLLNIMHSFSTPTSLQHVVGCTGRHVTSLAIVDILIWLLRHRILTQFHTFLYHVSSSNGRVVARNEMPRSTNQLRSSDRNGHSAFAAFPQAAELAEYERQSRVVITHEPEDLHRLMVLLQRGYLTGKYHVEEIAFHEHNVPMDILWLISNFQDVIRTYEAEDSIVYKCNSIRNETDVLNPT